MVIDRVTYYDGAYQAIEGTDALVIVTEWDAFRALDLKRVKTMLPQPIPVDLRNIYPRDVVEREGVVTTAVGR